MTEYLDWMRKNYQVYRWLAVVNADGRIIAATNPASVGKDMSRTHLFRVVREQGGVHIQDVEVSEDAGGIPVIGFSGPILDAQEKFRGAVLSQVTLSSVEDVASAAIHTFQVQRGSTGKIEHQIMTRDGDLLVDSMLHQEMQVNLKLMALPSALLSASALPGYIEEQHLRRKVPVVTGYSGTEGYGDFTGLHWGVLVGMDRSDILAPIRTVLQNLALAGALIVLPLLGFLLWTSGRLQAEYLRAREESARAMAAEATLRLRDRAIAETSNGILITDPHQRDNPIIYVNPAFERITGYRMDEVLGRNCRFLQGTDTDPATVAVMRQAIAEQRDCQVVIRNYRKDGATFWNELTISPVHDGSGRVTHFVGVLVDISARKDAEEAIERLSRQNELILNAAGEGIFGLDLQGKTTFVNPAAARMVGWSVAELIGQPMHPILHHTKPDGTPYPEEECPIYASFKDGVIHRLADEVFWRRDGTSFPVEYVSTPIRERGEVVGAVVVFIDTTLRKEEEERRMQVEKLAALGQVAAGVAHGINNPFAGIKNTLLLLKETIAPGHPDFPYVGMNDPGNQRDSDIGGATDQLV